MRFTVFQKEHFTYTLTEKCTHTSSSSICESFLTAVKKKYYADQASCTWQCSFRLEIVVVVAFFWKGLSLVGNIQQSAISANNVRTTENGKKTESIIKVAQFRQLI